MEKRRTLKNWIIATRPWALPASVMPILIMWAYLYSQSDNGAAHINWLNALLCLPLLSIVHSGGNMVSDYFDFTWGVDTKACSNGVTWIHDGTFRPKEILRYGLVLVALAVPIGVFLLYNSSWSGWWIGLAGVLLALVYPWMKSHHLGDINILVSFALLPALGTFFVAVGLRPAVAADDPAHRTAHRLHPTCQQHARREDRLSGWTRHHHDLGLADERQGHLCL